MQSARRDPPIAYHGAMVKISHAAFQLARTARLKSLQTRALIRRRRALRRYLSAPGPHLLQIGSENFTTAGWLATDLYPREKGVEYLDATKRWPIPHDTLDAIHCEHMIEHVPYDGAVELSREAYRCLKPGGTIRIVTPDMQLIRRLLDGELPEYAGWSNGTATPPRHTNNPIFTINRMMRDWGHTFIYDEDTLTALLHNAGFVRVGRLAPGVSDNPHLRDVDRHAEAIGEQWNLLESMVVEATK